MQQLSSRTYLRQIQSAMPSGFLGRCPERILWLPFHLIIIGLLVAGILSGWSWPLCLMAAIGIGHAYGCLMFMGHELIHDSVLKPGRLQTCLAWICFLPYCIGPTQWRTWHNHWHHRNTSLSSLDPDSWGNLATYSRRPEFRFVEPLSPGSKCLRSIPFFFYWFSAQGLLVMLVFSRLLHYWDKRERRKVWLQIVTGVGFWVTVALAIGWPSFLWIYVLPLAIANAVQMAYIATNHLLMPETKSTNDPLINSLTVTTNRLCNLLHLNFSYHVEHHVCPGMSPKYAPAMQAALKEHYPERYKQMPHGAALRQLYKAPKLHWDEEHLVNPRTGDIFRAMVENTEVIRVGRVQTPIKKSKSATIFEAEGFIPAEQNH